MLLVQHDGFILKPSAWQDNFLEYDYIGAPILIGEWTQERHDVTDSMTGSLVVGNGGFSLRSKKLLELTAMLGQAGDFELNEPEDWAMSYIERTKLETAGIKFAPVSVAEAFSFEGRSADYCLYKDSFGFHSFRWTDLSEWLREHSEYQSRIKNKVEMEGYYKV